MMEQQQPDRTIEALTSWARSRQDVGAVLLTSTRAVPGAALDAYSDYDVIVVVEEVEPLVRDVSWLAEFGEVLIAYWDPVEVDAVTVATSVGNITQYVDGLKIDFSLWSGQKLGDVLAAPTALEELDAGYRVLLDKADL